MIFALRDDLSVSQVMSKRKCYSVLSESNSSGLSVTGEVHRDDQRVVPAATVICGGAMRQVVIHKSHLGGMTEFKNEIPSQYKSQNDL